LSTCNSTFVFRDFPQAEKQAFQMELEDNKKALIYLTKLKYGVV